MIRTVLTLLFLVGFFLVSIPFYIFLPLISKINPSLAGRTAQRVVCSALSIVSSIAGIRLSVEGASNIPRGESVVYIANHRSYFDIVTTYPLLPGLTGYVAKHEINKVPLLKYWMRLLHGLTFDRDDPRSGMNMILSAIDQIKGGYSIFIFPEGTRSKDGKLGEFKAGSVKAATRTNCRIVPVSISGTDEVFEKHVPFIQPADVKIKFGKPFRPSELPSEEKKHLAKNVQTIIEEMLQ